MHYIAALDVGTTTVRCFVLNEKCEIKGSAVEAVELLNPKPGHFEIEPEGLWRKIINVMKDAVKNAQILPAQLSCLAISTQRCTFLSWNHVTQEYFHNFITWKDLRSDCLVDEWNNSLTLKTLNTLSYVLYLITRSNRFLAGSVLKMMNGQVTLRLLYEMQNNLRLKEVLKTKSVRFEFLDSWILYKLRYSTYDKAAHVEHITDITSATATGLFDPFVMDWSPIVKYIFGIDSSLLPKIVKNSHKHFGYINCNDFGPEWRNCNIPITSSVSDQAAALFGSQCFAKGDVKITIGTGAFLDLITGNRCYASLKGMYPLVAWQFDEPTFCVEGAAHDMGSVIAWGQSCGLFAEPSVTSGIAESVTDTNGVFFVPAFSGLGTPINDHKAASGFIGITPSTKRAHLIRALLESIVFRLVQLSETAEQETDQKLKILRLDGGVSRNNFVCQFLADASGIHVERASNHESSIMGATYAAGVNLGLWKNFNDVIKFRHVERVFEPNRENFLIIRERMNVWLKAVNRFSHWYS